MTFFFDIERDEGSITDLVERALQSEEVVLTKSNRPVAKLVPAEARQRRFGSARGLIELTEDFEAPLEDFEEHR